MMLPDESPAPAPPGRKAEWARVRSLVEQALALPREERSAFLDSSCDTLTLRQRVERLVDACERAGESWGFLARPAGELVAPLLAVDTDLSLAWATHGDAPPPAFYEALADRYDVGPQLGRGGMATVFVAEDLRHQRRVALKVLEPHLGAMLGAERFLTEIRVTARLQHPNLLPLFDSGDAAGRLYYVMPLVEGATLRERLKRERQLPVEEAISIARVIAGALDYAHRQGVVHRDLKPENILMHDGQPLVADFGIALSLAGAAATSLTAPGISLGTPEYMSPEQAAGDAVVDNRSDIYSLACVLYELLTGDPPFTGSTVQGVIAKVRADIPSSVRIVRPSVPVYVEAALARALAKAPADRQATAIEFANALAGPSPTDVSAPATEVRRPASAVRRLLPQAVAVVSVLGLAALAWSWSKSRAPEAAPGITIIPYRDLINESLTSGVTITPNGRALVYTGAAGASQPMMIWQLDQRTPQAIPGTDGGRQPAVAHDGQQLLFVGVGERVRVAPLRGVDRSAPASAWRFGNDAWMADGRVVLGGPSRGLYAGLPDSRSKKEITRPDPARGEDKHASPFIVPRSPLVVFTVALKGGPGLVRGPLAIVSADPDTASSGHIRLGVEGRRAVAYVDGWLLYTSSDGRNIMAVRLDTAMRRIEGTPVSVLEDEAGNLETASLADNGTLLYLRRPRANTAVIVDARGVARPFVTHPEGSFMHPRVSPDGRTLAVQVTSATGNDIWLYDVASGTRTRLTTTGRGLHPTWTPDGQHIVFMTTPRVLMSQPVDGSAPATEIPGTKGGWGPDVTADGKFVTFQVRNDTGWSVWSMRMDGQGTPRRLGTDPFSELIPTVSPDGRWAAYVSTIDGRNEVHARPFSGDGPPIDVSLNGGTEPAWSRDGHRLYYRAKGKLMVADVDSRSLRITNRREQFVDVFDATMAHRNYDLSADGSRFYMISPYATGNPEAVVVLNWLAKLRQQLQALRPGT